MQKMVIKTL